jgi:hypothetical protein
MMNVDGGIDSRYVGFITSLEFLAQAIHDVSLDPASSSPHALYCMIVDRRAGISLIFLGATREDCKSLTL